MTGFDIFLIIVIVYIVYCVFFKSKGDDVKLIHESVQAKKIIDDILATGYIDINVCCDHIEYCSKKFSYASMGYQNLTLQQAEIFAKKIMSSLPNKTLYSIYPIISVDRSSDSYASVRHALGDYTSDAIRTTVGYKIHNKNYDIDRGIYKVYNEKTGKYDLWDVVNQKWIENNKLNKW